MKISELFEEMTTYFGKLDQRGCDCFKAGNEENEISGVGVSMFATPEVLRKCHEENINFLIVHEPVFYNHNDDCLPNKTAEEKKKLIDDLNVTIVRYHNHAHIRGNDAIYEGEIRYSELEGQRIITDKFAKNQFRLKEPMTAKELAKKLEQTLGIKHIKIAGEANRKGSRISCCFGTPGQVAEQLYENDFILTGEICEWELGETLRDLSQLGYNKAVLVMGHIGSERAGMMYLTDILKEKHPELYIKYIECGEVYSYTDDE